MRQFFIFITLMFFIPACQPIEETTSPQQEYDALRLQPERDSLFFSANNETQQFSLTGSIINTTEITISNSGVIAEASYTVRTIDTTFQPVKVSDAQWYSTNSAVATVSKGLVTAKSPGYASITAQIGNASTKPVVVNVRAVDTAPGLSLNPPYVSLIFENSVAVSGIVQKLARLRVSESNSGFLKDSIQYNADGTFGVTVTGLNQGTRSITARATHPTNSGLYTERTKTVIYYAPNSSEANAIVGNWLGTTLGKNFNFTISNSIIPTRYDISGTIDIQFAGIGLVKDINLLGLVNSNGTFNVSLSKDYQGFKISGKFDGYFQSTGTANGSYSARAAKSGWPTVSFYETWTAVKVP